jgi:hypothetical protein
MPAKAIHDDLREILDAVEIRSPVSYLLQGELRHIDPSSRPPGAAESSEGPDLEGSGLLAALGADLYERCYTRPGPAWTSRFDPTAQRDFVAALSAANDGRGTWEPGWRVGEVDDEGRVSVTKDALMFWVTPSGLRARGGALSPGESCRVRVAKEVRGLLPGFYLAIGDGDEDDERDDAEPLVRLYWHLRPDAAIAYMAHATTRLNAAGIPFRTKVLNDPEAYNRADAGVLYFGRRQFGRAREAIAAIHGALAASGGLRPDVPLFSKRLATGLGLAEDPTNAMSFGEHRCRLVARAICRSFLAGELDPRAKVERLCATFRETSLDPMRPYLEPRSSDGYALVASAERVSVRRSGASGPRSVHPR